MNNDKKASFRGKTNVLLSLLALTCIFIITACSDTNDSKESEGLELTNKEINQWSLKVII